MLKPSVRSKAANKLEGNRQQMGRVQLPQGLRTRGKRATEVDPIEVSFGIQVSVSDVE